MDIADLLRFIDQFGQTIGLFGFDAHLTHNAIRFTNLDGEDYVFELPEHLALDVSDAYRQPGRVDDFTHMVDVYDIGVAERVLVLCAQRRKLALLLED